MWPNCVVTAIESRPFDEIDIVDIVYKINNQVYNSKFGEINRELYGEILSDQGFDPIAPFALTEGREVGESLRMVVIKAGTYDSIARNFGDEADVLRDYVMNHFDLIEEIGYVSVQPTSQIDEVTVTLSSLLIDIVEETSFEFYHLARLAADICPTEKALKTLYTTFKYSPTLNEASRSKHIRAFLKDHASALKAYGITRESLSVNADQSWQVVKGHRYRIDYRKLTKINVKTEITISEAHHTWRIYTALVDQHGNHCDSALLISGSALEYWKDSGFTVFLTSTNEAFADMDGQRYYIFCAMTKDDAAFQQPNEFIDRLSARMKIRIHDFFVQLLRDRNAPKVSEYLDEWEGEIESLLANGLVSLFSGRLFIEQRGFMVARELGCLSLVDVRDEDLDENF